MRRAPRLCATFWLCAVTTCVSAAWGLYCLLDWEIDRFAGIFVLQLLIYGFAAWRLLKGGLLPASAERSAMVAILLVAVLLRGLALLAPQALSTDAFRYVWDGRVQAAGINPYRYIPADPALAALRDDVIYPNINRATYAHTIYPPTAQIAFLTLERLNDSITGMKVGMLAFDGITIACLIALLRRQGLPPTRVLLYAWHPLPIWEFAGTGHVDAVAIAFLMLAFLGFSRRAAWWTGAALAAATLVKFYPVIAAPALYRRWDWRMPLGFVLMIALLYLPYLGVGSAVFGFLSGYATEEGLRDGSGILLWSLLEPWLHLPPTAVRWFAPLAALALIGCAAWTQFSRRGRGAGDPGAVLLLAGVFTFLVSPHDPWYFTWLAALLCFRFSLAFFWLTGACVLMYVMPDPTSAAVQSMIYLPFVVLLLVQYLFTRHFKSPERIDANRAQTPASI